MLIFRIDDEMQIRILKWNAEHDKMCPHAGGRRTGAIGGRFTYSFTGTTLGEIIKVKCACGEEFDPTDYSDW